MVQVRDHQSCRKASRLLIIHKRPWHSFFMTNINGHRIVITFDIWGVNNSPCSIYQNSDLTLGLSVQNCKFAKILKSIATHFPKQRLVIEPNNYNCHKRQKNKCRNSAFSLGFKLINVGHGLKL